MANILQEFEKFKSDEKRKIAELKVHISKVIEEFLNATEKFCEREDLTDFFNIWSNNLTYYSYIVMCRKENGTMEVYENENETDLSRRNIYTNVYDTNVFEEVNAFLEKTFSWLGFEIGTYAYLRVIDDGISIELEFEPCVDHDSLVPEDYYDSDVLDPDSYVDGLYEAMCKILRQTGAQVEILDDDIQATYRLG